MFLEPQRGSIQRSRQFFRLQLTSCCFPFQKGLIALATAQACRGYDKPEMGVRIALISSFAPANHPAQVQLSFRNPALRGLSHPLRCIEVILLDSNALSKQDPEIKLGANVPLLRSLRVQCNRHGIVLIDTIAIFVQAAEAHLSNIMALFSSFTKPSGGLSRILFDPLPAQIQRA